MMVSKHMPSSVEPYLRQLLAESRSDPSGVGTAIGGLIESADANLDEQLLALVQDRTCLRPKVREKALGVLGDLEPLGEHRDRSTRDRAEFERILSGDIPPLPKLWPGDRST